MTIPMERTCDNCGKDDIARYEIDEAEFFLCPDCAVNAGFCLSCGGFFGGTEEWFRSSIRGMCVDCRNEVKFADEYEPDDFEY